VLYYLITKQRSKLITSNTDNKKLVHLRLKMPLLSPERISINKISVLAGAAAMVKVEKA